MTSNPRQVGRNETDNPEGPIHPIGNIRRTTSNIRERSRGGKRGSSRGLPLEQKYSIQESSSSGRARGRGRA